MRSKKLKVFVSILLIIVIIFINATYVMAGLIDGAKGESGHSPDPPTPPDANKPSQPSTPSQPSEPSGPEVVTIEHKVSITGNIYEDLGIIIPGTNGNDATRSKTPIDGAVVKLIDSSGNVVATQVTGQDGSYSFSPSPGTYSVELQYGNIDGLDLNNTNLIRNVLKYNGHDYITVETPNSSSEGAINIDKEEVILGGKGVAQVFLLIDCSYTTRTTEVNINGETKTRLEIIADAAKSLIDELLDSGDNIEVGLVFFSGTCYIPVHLEKDKELLKNALDDIVSNGWYTHNTNMVAAFDKAENNFYNNSKEDSNRYMIILSDAIPTSDGTHETYSDMTDEEIMSTLEIIKKSTKERLAKVKENGIKIFSLIVESDDEMEREWAKDVCSESDVFKTAKDGQKMVDAIQEELKEYIIKHTDSKDYSSESTVITGYEDSNRRKEVDEKFETFKYDNTIIFDQIDSYNATEEDKEQATELSEKTYMIVKAGSYSIDSVPNPSTIYEYDDEGNIVKIIHHVASSYSGQNFVLAKRPAMSLKLTVTATAFRIKLADGQVLLLDTREIGSDVPLIEYMDDEIAHGATIDVQYQINIKNDSNIQCNYLELVNYLPQGFVFAKSANLLTKEGTNGDFGWVEASVNYLYDNGYISKDTKTAQQGKRMSTIKLDYKNDGFYITPRWGI